MAQEHSPIGEYSGTMKQSLQLKLGQSLTMTPQLQQAIRLLQLSAVDLQAEVQELLENNPLLEATDSDDSGVIPELDASGAPIIPDVSNYESSSADMSAEEPIAARDNSGEETLSSENQLSEIPDDLPVDTDWEEIFDAPLMNTRTEGGGEGGFLESQVSSGAETLHDHLLWQLQLTPFSDQDRIIAEAILDAINDDGYLSVSIESLWEGLKEELPVELDEVQVVLHRIQQFDPPGVAGADLRDCLRLQLQHNTAANPVVLAHARALIDNFLEVLGSRDYAQIMRRMQITREELQQAVELIQTLNPRPGTCIESSRPEYVVPDVIVRKVRNQWRVELNSDAMPRLRINTAYAGLIKRADSSAENTYLKNNLQEARWFIKSLQSRNETLLKVAQCIVERQQGFLERGDEAMRALVLHDVAEAVEMHESTISRVTSQKYMHTPRGIFELKYFFSSHVSTSDGDQCSATAIRAFIKKMIAEELADKPLSDSKIASMLKQQGINVARRTVAKYREAMGVPPSNERKRLS